MPSDARRETGLRTPTDKDIRMTVSAAGFDSAGTPVIDWDYAATKKVLGYITELGEMRKLGPVLRNVHGETPDYYIVTDGEAIREAYQSPEIFSSSATNPIDPNPPYLWIPQMLDPPTHTAWRQLLQPAFAPRAVAALEEKVTRRCVDLLDSFASDGQVDFLPQFAQRFPTTIFMDLMGLPTEDLEKLIFWEDEILHLSGNEDPGQQRAVTAMFEVMNYFDKLIELRRGEPRSDLLSDAINWKLHGDEIPHVELLSFCLLMFMAGLDTVSIQLSYMFWHLATHDADRTRVAQDLTINRLAVEEFLRAYSFVPPSRKVMRDVTFRGCPMRAGEMVYLPLTCATRDPKIFADADKVVLDRSPNNHVAFGAGPHRCLGSHLARQELQIALREWHARIPTYRLAPGQDVTEHGTMYGIKSLRLKWDH